MRASACSVFHCVFSGAGTRTLCTAIDTEGALPKLRDLHLDSNLIKDDGLIAILGRLTNLPDLRVVYMNNNQVGNRGMQSLAEKIKTTPFNQDLPSFDLSENPGDKTVVQRATEERFDQHFNI